jgi:hypothetical protein
MALPIILGANQATLCKVPRSWAYQSGETIKYIYRGPRALTSAIYDTAKAVNAFTPVYDSIEDDPGRGIGTATLTVVQDAQTSYELCANKILKPIEQIAYYAIDDPALTGDQIVFVMEAFNCACKKAEFIADSRYTGAGGSQAKLLALLTDLSFGITEKQETVWVLRETRMLSKRTLYTLDHTGVNTVVDLPNVAAINTILNMGGVPGGEWLKDAPTLRTYGNQKWAAVQEWQWAQKWSKRLYGGTWEPIMS